MQQAMTRKQLQELLEALQKDYGGPEGLQKEVVRVAALFKREDCRAGVVMFALGAEAFDRGASLDETTRSFLSLFAVGYTAQQFAAAEKGGGSGGGGS